MFQYNADSMRRTLADRSPPEPKKSAGAAKQSVLKVGGPPIETIAMTIELEAADQLDAPNANRTVAEHGLYPALALLELLMYPPALAAEKIEKQAAKGAVQVSDAEVPLVLLVWGPSRVVPVDVTGFSVTEEAFDSLLNPVRAKVELTLQVLTYLELPAGDIGRDAFISYQKSKEAHAGRHQEGENEQGIRTVFLRGG